MARPRKNTTATQTSTDSTPTVEETLPTTPQETVASETTLQPIEGEDGPTEVENAETATTDEKITLEAQTNTPVVEENQQPQEEQGANITESTLQPIEEVESTIEVEDANPAIVDEKITLPAQTNEEPKVTIQATPEKTLAKVEEEVIELPRPKTTASKTAAVITKTELPLPTISLTNITLEELVQRKHNFNIANAGGDLLEVIQFLDRYQDKMRAGLEVPPEQGESLQKQLYKIYLRILSLDSTKERDVALEILLWKYYKDEKGAFKVTQLGRFTRNGRWIIQELNMFLQLNHIFNSVKNPQERIVRLKQFKLSAIIAGFPGDKIRYTESFLNWASSLH